MLRFAAFVGVLTLLPSCGGQAASIDSISGSDANEPSAGGESASRAGTTSTESGGNAGDSNAANGGAASGPTSSVVGGMSGSLPPSDPSGGVNLNGPGGEDPCGPGGCIASDPSVEPIEPPEPALCGGVECAVGEGCCLATGQCFDPKADDAACQTPEQDDDPWGRKACSSNAHCGELEFCAMDSFFVCQGSGHCNPISNCGECNDGGTGACVVCACDGNTYPNIQTACRAGANVVASSGAACGESVTVGGGGASGAGQVVTTCRTSEHCPSGETCCALTARCYPAAESALCQLPPDGASVSCLTNDQCSEVEYCYAESCAGPGGCFPRDTDECGILLEPVCGCDGRTYTSEACASKSGVRVATAGECGAE